MDADHALRALLRCLVLPPVGPMLLAAIGWWLRTRRVRGATGLVVAAIAMLVLLSTPMVAERLSMWVEGAPPPVAAQPRADVIVVLGGGLRRPPPPAAPALRPIALERLAGGAALARRTGLPLLVTGGAMGEGPAEADVMQATLREAFGLEARFLERRARDTHENAIESARLLRAAGLSRVLLVTSAVHMPRAATEFRSAGLTVIEAPVGAASEPVGEWGDWLPSAPALAVSDAALYELLGRQVARLHGRR